VPGAKQANEQWLREAVYKRVAKPGRKPGFKSTMATFATSALWHGVNLAYYLTFLFAGFVVPLGRHIRKHVRPFFLHGPPAVKVAYDVLGIMATQMVTNYMVVPFMLLELEPSLTTWRKLRWYGHIIVFVPLVFFWAGGGRYLDRLSGGAEKKDSRLGETDATPKEVSQSIPAPPVEEIKDEIERMVEKRKEE
jgi:lysophospholipid acyltransferase